MNGMMNNVYKVYSVSKVYTFDSVCIFSLYIRVCVHGNTDYTPNGMLFKETFLSVKFISIIILSYCVVDFEIKYAINLILKIK